MMKGLNTTQRVGTAASHCAAVPHTGRRKRCDASNFQSKIKTHAAGLVLACCSAVTLAR